ncbi:MAG: hypothetical protein LBR73_08450 [Oscillospiraceae bacterium]|jgi:uncharacterized protein YgiM (DUF1202 family)|nr:hypothetical protein [Oscillospiraceae bacterium]
MKRAASFLLAFVLVLCAFGVGVSAKSEVYTVASTSGVAVRSGPGQSYKSLGAIGIGAAITVSETKTDTYGSTWGYVSKTSKVSGSWGKTSGGWVNLAPCPKGAPVKYTVTVAGGLWLRTGASAASKKIVLLPKGTVLTVSSTKKAGGYTWGFVAYTKIWNTYDGYEEWFMREGYAALDYCKKS